MINHVRIQLGDLFSSCFFIKTLPRYLGSIAPLTPRMTIVNYRFLLTFATLLPMIIYYLKLGLAPKVMATHFILGMPESIFWGVAIMLWGVLMAFAYVIIHQNTQSVTDRSQATQKGDQ